MMQYYIQPPIDQADVIFKLLLEPSSVNEHLVEAPTKGFKDSILDNYLSLGYYRRQNELFTTNTIQDGFYGRSEIRLPVFFIRTLVSNIQANKENQRIRKKCNQFSVSYHRAFISDEIGELYKLSQSQFETESTETCVINLRDFLSENLFDSWMIQIMDSNKLIAVAYFDLGKNSIMRVLDFCHPDYKKLKLDKYLILREIDFAIENKKQLYYSGLISTSSSIFDHKYFPDSNAMEVFLPIEKLWMPILLYNKTLLFDYFMENILEINMD